MRDAAPVAEELYDQLLASVGRSAPAESEARVVGHWPHVGSVYDGVVILGQAVYGWSDDFDPRTMTDYSARAEALRAIRARNTDRDEPMDWLATHRVRSSPFWTVARLVAEALTPVSSAPWISRFAWANLYPVAPEMGNPGGWLRAAQDPAAGALADALMTSLNARVVVALVGPYWWPTGTAPQFLHLEQQPRPLARSGIVDGTAWIVGWHPGGASRRGYPPRAYAEIIVNEARRLGV
ncbi:MAG: hypothetical protein ABI725_01190 [Chloroflexota bacterium]